MITVNGGILTQEVTGVQRYALEILSSIAEILKESDKNYGKLRVVHIGNQVNVNNSLEALNISTPNIPRPIWTQLVLPFFNKGTLLSLGNIGPVFCQKQILCIHDANVYTAPESYTKPFEMYYKFLAPIIARRVKHLVTVSDFSRNMLIKYNISGNRKVHVIPNGHEHALRWDQSRSNFFGTNKFERPFVFLIGSKAPHKNTQIIESIAKPLDDLGIDLVIAGRSGQYYKKVDQTYGANIIRVGAVTDDDLAFFYKRALCLAFPSITEGFGLPLLEAMALGCPVIASNAASLPEVGSSAALYADPHNAESWLMNIMNISNDEGHRKDLIEAGLVRSKAYSWSKSANKYLELIV